MDTFLVYCYTSVYELADDIAQKTNGGLFWYCQTAHFLLVINAVKANWDSSVAKTQPLLTWLLSMICCFGGGIMVKLFVGGKPLACFDDNLLFTWATVIWWLVFYFPLNGVSKLMSNTVVVSVLSLFKEILRSRKVIKGVTLGTDAYPNSLISPIFLGVVGSCGGSFLKSSATLFNSQWTPNSIIKYKASFVTRCCLVFSVFHVMLATGVLSDTYISHNLIALCQACVVYLLTMIQRFMPGFDPTNLLEQTFSLVFISAPEHLCSLAGFGAAAPKSEPAPKSKTSKKKD